MAWPSTSARTKTWGTEILTSGDLQGQFDLLHTYNNDQLNGTSGHKHSGGTNDGPLIPLTTGVTGTLPAANGGSGIASFAVGDMIYASASTTLSKLSPSTAGQAVTSAGATTAPIFAGMTTQGDIEYRDATTRQRLAAGTLGQALLTQGAGANPIFGNTLASVSDYASSSSSSTSRQGTAIKVAYGVTGTLTGGGGAVTITNLPFTNSTSYVMITAEASNNITTNGVVTQNSGSSATITNSNVPAGSQVNAAFNWFAIGI